MSRPGQFLLAVGPCGHLSPKPQAPLFCSSTLPDPPLALEGRCHVTSAFTKGKLRHRGLKTSYQQSWEQNPEIWTLEPCIDSTTEGRVGRATSATPYPATDRLRCGHHFLELSSVGYM